jgi:aminotransferase
MSNVSDKVKSVEISGIRKFFNKVSQVPEAVSLTLGQPDFSVPKKVKDAIVKAVEEDKTGYTSNAGILELRKEIANYLNRFDIEYDAEEICMTIGGSEGLLSVFMAILNDRDKVMIPTPAYPAYESCVKLVGGEIINYNLNDDFSINIEEIERVIEKESPKVIVVSYPSNPTGAILSEKDRNSLYHVLKDKDIIIITDEIYGALCFEKYYSIAQAKDLRYKTILISGFSKTFSMTGLRLGYVCAAKEFMDQIIKVHQYNVSCAPSIVQYGALEGLRSCLNEVEKMKAEFMKRRDYIYDRLVNMGIEVVKPKGAFYIFPSIKKYNMGSEEFCDRLLREAKLAIVPGSAFGSGGEGYVRISYSYSMQMLEEGLNRLEAWLKEIKN